MASTAAEALRATQPATRSPAAPRTTGNRVFFTARDDIVLLREVLVELPYQYKYGGKMSSWSKVANHFNEQTGQKVSGQSCHERTDRLLTHYRTGNLTTLRRRSSPEEQREKEGLLEELNNRVKTCSRFRLSARRSTTQQSRKSHNYPYSVPQSQSSVYHQNPQPPPPHGPTHHSHGQLPPPPRRSQLTPPATSMPAAPHPHHAHSYPFDATSRYAAHPPSHNHSHSLPHSFDHYRPATHSVPLSPTIAANQGQAVLLTNPGVTPPTSGFAHRTVVPLAPLATTTTPTSNTGGTAGPSGSYHSPQHPLPSLPSVYATHKGDPPATGRTIQQTTPSLAATPILPNLTPLSTVIAHAAQVEPTSPSHPVLPAVQSAGPCSTAVTVATSGMVPSVADLPSSLRRHSASNNATLAPTAYHPRTEDPTEHVPRSVLQDLVDLRRCELDLQEKRMRTDQLLMARAEERDRDQRTFFESLLHQQNAFLERQSLSYERLLHQHMELCRKYFGDDRSSSYAGSALSSPLPSSPLDCTEGGSATCSSPTRVSKSPSATPMSSAPAAAVVTPNST